MKWLIGRKLLVASGLVLVFTIAGVAVQGPQSPTPRASQGQVQPSPRVLLPPTGPGDASLPDPAANRALARRQLALIDEAWTMLETLHNNARIRIDAGTIGPWGRRRLEALRRAGAGKAEIVAAVEKYSRDLERFEETSHTMKNHHHPSFDEYEIQFLRLEAGIWLNEERAR